jgi:hypothetical protein
MPRILPVAINKQTRVWHATKAVAEIEDSLTCEQAVELPSRV